MGASSWPSANQEGQHPTVPGCCLPSRLCAGPGTGARIRPALPSGSPRWRDRASRCRDALLVVCSPGVQRRHGPIRHVLPLSRSPYLHFIDKEPKAQRMHHSAIFKFSRYNRCPRWLTQVSKHLCVPCLLVGCRLAGPGWLCRETSFRLQSDPSGLLLPGPPGPPGPTLWRLQEHKPPLSLTLLIRKAHSTVVLSLLGWRRSP